MAREGRRKSNRRRLRGSADGALFGDGGAGSDLVTRRIHDGRGDLEIVRAPWKRAAGPRNLSQPAVALQIGRHVGELPVDAADADWAGDSLRHVQSKQRGVPA